MNKKIQKNKENAKVITAKEISDSIKKEIDNAQDVIDAINEMWQGTDKEKFLNDFSKKRNEIKKELDKIYNDFDNKFEK